MAWSTPRTWVDGEIVTATEMNTDVRDNMAYLKANGSDGFLHPFLLMGS